MYDLFSKYGVVVEVKMKKPTTHISFNNVNSMPCSAYVNFADATQARAAIEALNGKPIIRGGNTLRIDYY